MSIEKLLRDYNIPYITEGHKRTTQGWLNTHCPFCTGNDYHLGISQTGGCHCWRCGGHPIKKVLSNLLKVPEKDVSKIIKRYHIFSAQNLKAAKENQPQVSINPFKLPHPNGPLEWHYKKYLEKRGFDVDKIEKEWRLLQTGPVSFLDDISFSHRILIPIYWDGKMVSFQARDITDSSKLKYISCPKKREIIHHKSIVYGKQEKWSDAAIIVEGVTDVWRFGPSSVATLGVGFKIEQVLVLAKNFDRLFIIFDDEPQAQLEAKKLQVKLKVLGKVAFIEKIKGDPGDMNQEDADHLVKQLI